MKKWILVLLILAVGAFGFYKTDPLSLFNKETESSLLNYIPADTVFYAGGTSDKAVAEFMADYPLFAPSSGQSVDIEAIKAELFDQHPRFGKLLGYLIEDHAANSDGTYADVVDWLGLAHEGEYALYMHGAVPVMNIALADSAKFTALVEKASAQAEFEYTEATLGNASLKSWALDSDKEQGPELVIATTEKSAIITVFAKSDSEQIRMERLAQSKVANSLASSGEIAQLKKQYGYTGDMTFLLNLERFMAGLLGNDGSGLAKDLLRYLPEEEQDALVSNLSEECKADYLKLAASAPRMVGGYTSLEVDKNLMSSDFQFLWEIKNAAVSSEIQKLQGHIPAHTLDSKDKLLGFGVAVDMDQLTPALTALWTSFVNADFKCDKLIEAQTSARQTSPAMLGMATGMAQGVKGLGLSIFGLNWDFDTQQLKGLDAVVSIAAANPQSVLSLTQMVPLPVDLTIPPDGTVKKIESPMLPPGIELYASVKGQHIALYTGGQGEKVAEALANESLEANGLYSFAMNYRKLAELAENLDIKTLPIESYDQCVQYHEFLWAMDAMRMDFSMLFKAQEQGLETLASASIDKPKKREGSGAEKYNLDEVCQQYKAISGELPQASGELPQENSGK